MLTGEQIEAILERAWVRSARAHEDASAMAAEIDRLAGQLSDCWLFLDEIARGETLTIKRRSEALLRKQNAPGWKS